jgi:hypothetical protein
LAFAEPSSFADPTLTGYPPPHRRRWRLLLEKHPLELSEIAVIEKPAII